MPDYKVPHPYDAHQLIRILRCLPRDCQRIGLALREKEIQLRCSQGEYEEFVREFAKFLPSTSIVPALASQ